MDSERVKVTELKGETEMFIFQFRFYDRPSVASCLTEKIRSQEPSVPTVTPQESGQLIFESRNGDRACIANLPQSLKNKGWVIRNAFFEKRYNGKQHKNYWIVRFVLVRSEGAEINPNVKGKEPQVEKVLQQCCSEPSESTTGFENPFFLDGKRIPGKSTLLIECKGKRSASSGINLVLNFKRTRLDLGKPGIEQCRGCVQTNCPQYPA